MLKLLTNSVHMHRYSLCSVQLTNTSLRRQWHKLLPPIQSSMPIQSWRQ